MSKHAPGIYVEILIRGTILPQGQRTSALKFWSDDWKSLIRTGSGYWKYTPRTGGIQFETGYDYEVRFSRLGEWIDRLLFRPLIGWATAWSFDRLRLWIENKTEPAAALRSSVTFATARIFLATALLAFGLTLLWIWNLNSVVAANSGGVPFIILLGIALGVAITAFWAWQTRALRLNIPFARHCRRERGS